VLPRLYTEREAAEILGISLATLRRERDRGKIRHRRFGARTIKFTETDTADYLEAAARGRTWEDEASEALCGSGNTSSTGEGIARTTMLSGTTAKPDRQLALHSALMTLSPPKSSSRGG